VSIDPDREDTPGPGSGNAYPHTPAWALAMALLVVLAMAIPVFVDPLFALFLSDANQLGLRLLAGGVAAGITFALIRRRMHRHSVFMVVGFFGYTGLSWALFANAVINRDSSQPRLLQLESIHHKLTGTRSQTEVASTWNARIVDPVSGALITLVQVPKPPCRNADQVLVVVERGLFGWRWANPRSVRFVKGGKVCGE
jgi:hypothetical protein